MHTPYFLLALYCLFLVLKPTRTICATVPENGLNHKLVQSAPPPKSPDSAPAIPLALDTTPIIPTKITRTIGPSFFYNLPYVVCIAPAMVYDGTFQPLTNTPYLLPQHFIDWMDRFPDANTGVRLVTARQYDCKTCLCEPDSLAIVENPVKGSRCQGHIKAELCVALLGCYCRVTLGQPEPTHVGVRISDYQNAIDQISQYVRFSHPDGWTWTSGPRDKNGNHLTFTQPPQQPDYAAARASIAYLRRKVPGTKEPYYVYGPQNDDTGYGWKDALRGLGSGYGAWAGKKFTQRYGGGGRGRGGGREPVRAAKRYATIVDSGNSVRADYKVRSVDRVTKTEGKVQTEKNVEDGSSWK